MRILVAAMTTFGLLFAGAVDAQTYCNNTPIGIGPNAGNATVYPSQIAVVGAPTPVSSLAVTINGFTHTFPNDVDMLLVGPGGQAFVIQSDAGGSVDTNTGYLISDFGSVPMPDNALLGSGHYRPTNHGSGDPFAAPAPAGPYAEPAPAGTSTFASVFGGTNPNGNWSLYVVDDANLDGGSIAGGWCVTVNQPLPRLRIGEVRVRGPSGANDEFVEVVNTGAVNYTVAAVDGSAGFAIAASDGTPRCVIPNGTVIAPTGHWLCANSLAYSLAGYPAGVGTTATGDATFTTDIPDNAGVALFAVSGSANFSFSNRIDAVGSTSEANTLYREGGGYPALTPFSIDSSFYRDDCGKAGSITGLGACSRGGVPGDTEDNAKDFIFVDTNGTSAGAGQRLGAPGPQNSSSPNVALPSGITPAPLDSCVSSSSPPNRVRDFTSDPANNSTFGTLDLRRTFINTTGVPLTRLRFRILDLTTFPAPSGYADLRPRTSTALVTTVDRPPCGTGASNVTVAGTTLEQPPPQPNGSGFNGSLSVELVPPLASGASIDVRFLLGIQQTGQFKFVIEPEALPRGSRNVWHVFGCTDSCIGADYIFWDSFNY
jgi:hypothetical protein